MNALPTIRSLARFLAGCHCWLAQQCRSELVRSAARGVASLALVLLLASVALACPTCKDQLAHDPQSQNIARGYAYSIVFMLSMPPLIFGGLVAYFYYEVRKARARQTLAA